MSHAVIVGEGRSRWMLQNKATTGSGVAISKLANDATFQVIAESTTGTITYSVAIDGSLDGVHWSSTAVATIAGTTVASGASNHVSVADAPWNYVRATVSSISGSGTGFNVSVLMGT